MTQFERGVYDPNEDVRAFDGSEDDDDVEGSRLPLLIVLALLVLAMFAGLVWLAYTQGVARGRTETPVLTAQNGPARIAPQNPSGTEQPYRGFKIYEQPAPRDNEVDAATMPAPALVPPTQVAQAPALSPPPPTAASKPVVAPLVAKKVLPLVTQAASAPVPAAPIGIATSAPRSLAAAKSAPVAAAAPAPITSPGGAILQIGAYKSKADADTAWKAYKAKHSALLAGANEDVQQAELGDKGTWYRLRIVGFPSKDVASAMCDRLKADGGGCFLGK